MGRVLQMQYPANCINCPKCTIDRKLDVLVYSVLVCSSSSKGKTQTISISKYVMRRFVGDGRLPA